MHSIPETYQSNTIAQCRRKCEEDMHEWTDPLHQPLIASPRLLKCFGLSLKYGQDGVDRVASLHLSRKRMVVFFLYSLKAWLKAASRIDLKSDGVTVWPGVDEDMMLVTVGSLVVIAKR